MAITNELIKKKKITFYLILLNHATWPLKRDLIYSEFLFAFFTYCIEKLLFFVKSNDNFFFR